jgi:DNA-binding SARP family transcriptional activator
MLNFHVLGRFGVSTADAKPIAPPRLVARVGTMLAGWPGAMVDKDQLIDELWGDRPPKTATNTLQAHISQLRRLAGRDTIVAETNGYTLDVDPPQVDAELFQELIDESARARRHLHLGRARELLTKAIDLWQGIPYADVTNTELRARAERLIDVRDVAFEDRLECELELARDGHDVDMVVAAARELVGLKPIRERRHALLIRALAATNQLAEANAAYEAAVRHIRMVTGADPGPLLAAINAQVNNPSDAVYPLAQRRILSDQRTLSRFVQPDEEIGTRIYEALVDHDAPAVVVHAEQPDHERIAECLRVQLLDDFPSGVHIVCGTDIDDPFPDVSQGGLLIVTAANLAAIENRALQSLDDHGAILIITSDASRDDLAVVCIDVRHDKTQSPSLPAVI